MSIYPAVLLMPVFSAILGKFLCNRFSAFMEGRWLDLMARAIDKEKVSNLPIFLSFAAVTIVIDAIATGQMEHEFTIVILSFCLSGFVLIGVMDFYFGIIPDHLWKPLVIIALLAASFDLSLISLQQAILGMLVGASLGWLVQYSLTRSNHGEFGRGDINLLVLIGAWFGAVAASFSLTMAIATMLWSCRSKGRVRKAFSPYLIVSCLFFLICTVDAEAASDGNIEGFASNMPVFMVARQIVPSDITVRFNASEDREQLVSWQGSGARSWQEILRETLDGVGLMAIISDHSVTIDKIPSRPWNKFDHWVAEPGQDLANVLKDWGRRVGITPVIHGGYRYPVESGLVFDCDFQDAAIRLVDAFSTAEPRPMLDIWSDGEKNYTIELSQGMMP